MALSRQVNTLLVVLPRTDISLIVMIVFVFGVPCEGKRNIIFIKLPFCILPIMSLHSITSTSSSSCIALHAGDVIKATMLSKMDR